MKIDSRQHIRLGLVIGVLGMSLISLATWNTIPGNQTAETSFVGLRVEPADFAEVLGAVYREGSRDWCHATALFILKNHGPAPVTLGEPVRRCGCLKVEMTKRILQAGESCRINATIDGDPRLGRQAGFSIPTDHPSHRSLDLVVRMKPNVKPPTFLSDGVFFAGRLQPGQGAIRFEVSAIEDESKSPWIAGVRGGERTTAVQIQKVESHRTQPGVVRRTYLIHFAPKNESGNWAETLELFTAHQQSIRRLQVGYVVPAEIELSPGAIHGEWLQAETHPVTRRILIQRTSGAPLPDLMVNYRATPWLHVALEPLQAPASSRRFLTARIDPAKIPIGDHDACFEIRSVKSEVNPIIVPVRVSKNM